MPRLMKVTCRAGKTLGFHGGDDKHVPMAEEMVRVFGPAAAHIGDRIALEKDDGFFLEQGDFGSRGSGHHREGHGEKEET